MPIRIDRIPLPLHLDDGSLSELAGEVLGIPVSRIANLRVTRRSIDARQKPNIVFIYAVEVTLDDPALEAELIARLAASGVTACEPDEVITLKPGERTFNHPPVIVGAGPAGLFAALLLAENGYRPLVIERGRSVEERANDHARFIATRTPDPESNLLFGEGGAGTWSDGKLMTRIRSPWIAYVLRALIEAGAPADIAIDAHPHVGTDLLHTVIPKVRKRIEALGGEVRFNCRLDSLARSGDTMTLGTTTGTILADIVILAPGSSARDTFLMLANLGVTLEPKPFQMGLRIEHPQPVINRAQYGSPNCHPKLTPAEYQLVHKAGEYSIHTFCVCPGGVIVPTVSEPGRLCINGMSNSARDGRFANAALVWTQKPKSSQPLAGIALQRSLEARAFKLGGGDYTAPAQRAVDFIARKPSRGPFRTSYALGTKPADLTQIMPQQQVIALIDALHAFGQRLRGFDGPEAVLLACESRASSPVRILRDPDSRQSVNFPGLYPVGEGAGYAGGITSAAVDGLISAQAVISRFARP